MISRKFLASAAAVAFVAVPVSSYAQSAAIDIAPQTLGTAIATLSSRSGAQITLGDGVASNNRTNPVSGAKSTDEALDQMLAGTGLSWRQTDGNSIEIVGSAVEGADGEHTLRALRVEGVNDGSSVFAPLDGHGSGAGANGSSDVTATEGTRSFTTNGASVATKMPLSIKDTPQTISVVTSEQIKQQNLIDVTGAMMATPGVTIYNSSAGGTPMFVSRGFAITNYQVDGGPTQTFPSGNSYLSQPDLSAYDHVEVVRGSNALFSGAADPSGVVNLQRKRPLDHEQMIIDLQGGSYNNYRGQVDVSTPLAFDGNLRGRAVASYHNNDTFKDRENYSQANFYGILEANLTSDTALRGGVQFQSRVTRNEDMQGLPRYSNGQDIDLPRSTNLTPWGRNSGDQTQVFGQFEHHFDDDWSVKLDVNQSKMSSDFYYGDVRGPVNLNNTGLRASSKTNVSTRLKNFTAGGTLNGGFFLFGHDQKFVIGTEYQKTRSRLQLSSVATGYVMGTIPIQDFDPTGIALPTDQPVAATRTLNGSRQISGYASLVLEPVDGLHLTGGVRYTNYKVDYSSGLLIFLPGYPPRIPTTYNNSFKSNFMPSVGASYEITPELSVYGSYAETFKPTTAQITEEGQLLDPARGRTAEGGLKYASTGGALNASIAYFNTQQRNVSVRTGFDTPITNVGACCYLPGGGIKAQGVDVQATGAITPSLQVNAGYTYTKTSFNDTYQAWIESGALMQEQSQQPKHQGKIWATWTLPADLKMFSISGGMRYEGKRGTRGSTCTTNAAYVCITTPVPYAYTQSAVVVVDGRLAYDPTDDLEFALNVTNLTNRKYYQTIYNPTSGSYYAPPRQFMLSAHLKY